MTAEEFFILTKLNLFLDKNSKMWLILFVTKKIINPKFYVMYIEDKISEGLAISQSEQMFLIDKGKTWLIRKYMWNYRLSAKAQILMVKKSRDRLFKDYVVRYDLAPIAQVKMIEMKNMKLFSIFIQNHTLSLIAQKKLRDPRYADMLNEYQKFHNLHPAALKN